MVWDFEFTFSAFTASYDWFDDFRWCIVLRFHCFETPLSRSNYIVSLLLRLFFFFICIESLSRSRDKWVWFRWYNLYVPLFSRLISHDLTVVSLLLRLFCFWGMFLIRIEFIVSFFPYLASSIGLILGDIIIFMFRCFWDSALTT